VNIAKATGILSNQPSGPTASMGGVGTSHFRDITNLRLAFRFQRKTDITGTTDFDPTATPTRIPHGREIG